MEKTYTLDEFRELLYNPDWEHETLIEPDGGKRSHG